MLSEHDLLVEIERYNRCQNLTPDDCVRLAAFYTILNSQERGSVTSSRSMAMPPEEAKGNQVSVDGDSEFLSAIKGKDAGKTWLVMNELMNTLSIINHKLYDDIMRRLKS